MFPKYFNCVLASLMAITSSTLTLNYIIIDNEKNNIRLKQLQIK